MPNKYLLITDHIGSRADFFEAFGNLELMRGRCVPRNLDALADTLRELDIPGITFTDYHADDAALAEVFDDLGIAFCR